MNKNKIKWKLKSLKAKFRRFSIFFEYKIQSNINSDTLVIVSKKDRQLGITTFLINESVEKSAPIVCNNLREKVNIIHLADKLCLMPRVSVFTVDDIMSNMYAIHDNKLYLSDCLSSFNVKVLKKRTGIKLKGFMRVS